MVTLTIISLLMGPLGGLSIVTLNDPSIYRPSFSLCLYIFKRRRTRLKTEVLWTKSASYSDNMGFLYNLFFSHLKKKLYYIICHTNSKDSLIISIIQIQIIHVSNYNTITTFNTYSLPLSPFIYFSKIEYISCYFPPSTCIGKQEVSQPLSQEKAPLSPILEDQK